MTDRQAAEAAHSWPPAVRDDGSAYCPDDDEPWPCAEAVRMGAIYQRNWAIARIRTEIERWIGYVEDGATESVTWPGAFRQVLAWLADLAHPAKAAAVAAVLRPEPAVMEDPSWLSA